MKYDKELTKILCQVCIDSYEGRHGEVKNVLTNIHVIEHDNVKAFVGKLKYKNKNYMVIVFPGSDGLTDWIDNMKFSKVYPYEHGVGIHEGFWGQYKKIKNRVWNITDYAAMSKYEIIFTGHSLGGALATVFSYCRSLSHCYTFGAPRVGNREFVKSFLDGKKYTKYNSIRVVNGEDTICKLPTLWLGYKHIPNKIHINKKLSWREKILWLPRKIFGNYKDHYPQRYIDNLK